jgi:hypothetical protein
MNALMSDQLLSLESGVRKSGRAVLDERGDAVWEWQVETGVFRRDVTDEQLRRLEAPHLRIVEFSPPARQGLTSRDSGRSAEVLERVSRRTPPRQLRASASGPLGLLWARLRGAY